MILSILLSYSCSPSIDIEPMAAEFAQLECRAIQLKERRFALAAEMNKLEEDTVKYKLHGDSLMQIIQKTKDASIALADTIRLLMDSLWKNELADRELRKVFMAKVEQMNAEQKCAEISNYIN